MFSTGQMIFVLFFIIAFTGIIIWSYRKDIALHQKAFKGSKWVLVGFISFVALLFVIKYVLKE